MKLVVFAHTPPPFHGQSYMVKLMLDGFQVGTRDKQDRARQLEIFHVDSKLSTNLEAIGKFSFTKLVRLLSYCAEAYFHRIVHKADHFYYVPAPGLRAPLYRDWLVMFLCRPIFRRLIFHWHAVGLGEWLEKQAKPWERWITLRLLGGSDLSIVLSEFGRADAMELRPKEIKIVPNGIPDPCPDFEQVLWPARRHRFTKRNRAEATRFMVLFVGACTEAKGLFALIEAVALANKQLREARIQSAIALIVAGEFASRSEQQRFTERISRSDLSGLPQSSPLVEYAGFVSGSKKSELFRRCDCLCFPSQYPAEGQPVTIIEALAFGMPIVATRWRGIPELLQGGNNRLVEGQDSTAIAHVLKEFATAEIDASNRQLFLARYTSSRYVDGLAKAFEMAL